MTTTTLQDNHIQLSLCLYMAFELSQKEWKLAFGIGKKNPRIVPVRARDLGALHRAIDKAKERFNLPKECAVKSCYEAGRDGFWLHRYLKSQGIDNVVLDSSSIEVPRRSRRAKTDKLDAGKLLLLLIRYATGENETCSVVRVPSLEDEDARRTDRELDCLTKERTRHSNRIKALLNTQGIVVDINRRFPKFLEEACSCNGRELGPHLKKEIYRQYQRWQQVDEQIKEIWKERRQLLKKLKEQQAQARQASREEPLPKKSNLTMTLSLMMLCGIGERSSWKLSNEFFWRSFNNRREVGSAAGLTGMPYNSGGSERDQGISKAGNRPTRAVMGELSWFWLRYQPDSALSKWYQERFGQGTKRMRRVGIVALARRLLIALWRYVEFGEVPQGAKLKSAV